MSETSCRARRSATVVLACALLPVSGCNPPVEVVEPADLRESRPGATAIVIVYSRSGNTAAVGRALAAELDADYLRILGRPGDGSTLFSTPRSKKMIEIDPNTVALDDYDLVLLGTPIWYWKPTAHINTFIKSNSFVGKDVVLFHTNQGGVSSDALDVWRELVRSRGGTVRDVFGIDRDSLDSGETLAHRAVKIAGARRGSWRAAAATRPVGM